MKIFGTTLAIILLIFATIYLYQNSNIDNNILVPPKTDEDSIILPPNNNQITVQGKIVKEKIPVELELGENWYWIYFDTPFFLQDNASGQPQYVHKLEVFHASKKTNLPSIDTLLNKHVEIVGELTWGYAESRVIQIISIKEII